MNTQIRTTAVNDDQDALLVKVPLQVMGLSMIYAAGLSLLERKYPIKPDHTWAEVAGGVMISLLPVALAARKYPSLDWRTYENAVWRSFFASGTPIILWQLSESILRHIELLRYAAERETRKVDYHADSTAPLANGSGGRARWSAESGDRGNSASAERSGEA